jgi:hypothetical protein
MKTYTITQQQIDDLRKHIKEENESSANFILDLVEADLSKGCIILDEGLIKKKKKHKKKPKKRRNK